MKRCKLMAVIIVIILVVIVLIACGSQSEFGLSENTEKSMTITAKNAEKNASFMAGSLEVEEDLEHIVISSDLNKGSIQVEIFEAAAEQSMDEIPDVDSAPIIRAVLKNSE